MADAGAGWGARWDARRAALCALPLLDLAALDDGADAAAVERLCARAHSPAGPVASVSVPARLVPHARTLLAHSAVRVASVANFPGGAADCGAAAAETEAAVAAGADEIAVVFPYGAALAGDAQAGSELVRRCRRACRRADGRPALLKIILETGRLGEAATIRREAAAAIDAGADFVVTSTGRCEPGATMPAATALLEAIAAARTRRIWAGLEIVGRIATLAEASAYMALGERLIDGAFVGPASFRLAAPRLLGEILVALGMPGGD